MSAPAPGGRPPHDPALLQTSARDLVFILFKRKTALLTFIGAGLLAALFWVLVIRDPAYQVTAKVLVKIGAELANPATMLDRPAGTVSYFKQDVNSEKDILQSTAVIAQVVDYFKMDQPSEPVVPTGVFPRIRYEIKRAMQGVRNLFDKLLIAIGLREEMSKREFVIMQLQQGLAVEAQQESNVLVATMALPVRQGSGMVLNKLLEFYQEFRRNAFRDAGAVSFFETRAAKSEADLQAAEEQLASFESSHNIVSIEKQKEVLLDRIAVAAAALTQDQTALQDASAKVARLEEASRKASPDFGTLGEFAQDSFPSKIMLDLANLEREREQLRMQEFEGGAKTGNNRQQFDKLLGVLGSNLRSVQTERRAARDERARELAGLEKQLVGLHDEEKHWNELKRSVKVLEGTYLFDRKKLDEASATSEIEGRRVGNVAVIQPAMDAVIPAGMRKLTLLALASLATLLGAFAWVAVAEFFDHRFYSADALERHLGVPVVAAIPQETGAGSGPG
jgi:uncharacterized protein involved in exopolysaccharide biosynthesis